MGKRYFAFFDKMERSVTIWVLLCSQQGCYINIIVVIMSTDSKQNTHFANSQHDSSAQINFSFDNMRTQAFQKVASTKNSIDQYLRLKTNESVDEKRSLPRSQKDPNPPRVYSNKNNFNKIPLKLEDINHNQNDHNLHMMQEENDLRIVSIIKQYELKLSKQEEYFELRECKLKQEIQNLTHQNFNLQEQAKKIRNALKFSAVRCEKCSDGQTIANLTRMLQQIEENHKDCIDKKRQLTNSLNESNSRLCSIQLQHQKLYEQSKNYTKQIRALNQKITKLQAENNEFRKVVQDKQIKLKLQSQKYENTVRQIHKKMNVIQQSSLIRQESQNVKNSKINANSTHSALVNNENNLNTLYMRPVLRDCAQPLNKTRSSMSKIMQSIDNIERRELGPSLCYRKASEDKNSQKSRVQNTQILKWKYF